MTKDVFIQELTDIDLCFINDIRAKSLTNLHQNMTKFILSCSNVKPSTPIYSPRSFSWSIMLLLILDIVKERQLKWTLFQHEVHENVLEDSICKVLPLTGVLLVPEDLHAYHRMKRLYRVKVKFKCCKQKQSLMYKRKNLDTKSQELTNLKFSGRLFVSESMSHANQQLNYNVDNSEGARKIHST